VIVVVSWAATKMRVAIMETRCANTSRLAFCPKGECAFEELGLYPCTRAVSIIQVNLVVLTFLGGDFS